MNFHLYSFLKKPFLPSAPCNVVSILHKIKQHQYSFYIPSIPLKTSLSKNVSNFAHFPSIAGEAYTPEAYTPEAYTPEAYTPEAYTPEVYTPEAYTPEAYTPENRRIVFAARMSLDEGQAGDLRQALVGSRSGCVWGWCPAGRTTPVGGAEGRGTHPPPPPADVTAD